MTHQDQPMNSEWLRRMADAEDECGGAISVGGFAHDLGLLQPAEHNPLRQTALGKLVEFARRKNGMSLEDLARRADIELADLVAIEQGGVVAIEPRTVCQLCIALELPQAGVMELAGLTQRRGSPLGAAAVRFTAHARGLEKLSSEERRALDDFVKDLAKAP